MLNLLIIVLSCISCSFSSSPASEMSYNLRGKFNGEFTGVKLEEKIFQICKDLRCKKNYPYNTVSPEISFFSYYDINENETIHIWVKNNKMVNILISQKHYSKPSIKLMKFLKEMENLNIHTDLVASERWECKGHKKSYNNCTKSSKSFIGAEIDLIEYFENFN